jgi:hypothetical protein
MKPIPCIVLAAALVAGASAMASVRGTTPDGIEYVSGGIGAAEKAQLRSQRSNYSLWVTTAALRSGAHLSGARVRIRDLDHQKLVLEHVMDGPWLFAALPIGRYEVEAILQPEGMDRMMIERGTTTIHAGDHHQMLLYFPTGDEVGERDEAPAR